MLHYFFFRLLNKNLQNKALSMVYFALRAIDRALFLQIKSNQAKKEILCPSTPCGNERERVLLSMMHAATSQAKLAQCRGFAVCKQKKKLLFVSKLATVISFLFTHASFTRKLLFMCISIFCNKCVNLIDWVK